MIPQRNLSMLANRLAASGDRRIPEHVLERDYCLAWFLVALSRTDLREHLAFKGGTAIKRCYEEAAGVRISFSRPDRIAHQNSYTFYLGYEGPLPPLARGREVKVDITRIERVVFPLVETPVLRGYDEYSDLPEDAAVRVYSLDEIATEKVVALQDRARNEPRDLYDLWYLTSHGLVDLENLVLAVAEKWEFRGEHLDEVESHFLEKEARLRSLWEGRLAQQMSHLPEFDEVFRAVQRSLRGASLIGRSYGRSPPPPPPSPHTPIEHDERLSKGCARPSGAACNPLDERPNGRAETSRPGPSPTYLFCPVQVPLIFVVPWGDCVDNVSVPFRTWVASGKFPSAYPSPEPNV